MSERRTGSQMKTRILLGTLVASGIILVAATLVMVSLCARSVVSFGAVGGTLPPDFETNWTKVRIGMSQDQVRDLLGNCDVSVGPIDWEKAVPDERSARAINQQLDRGIREGDEQAFNARCERWQYGSGGLESIANAPPQAYVVYFDSDKKVIAFRGPRADDR